jgi:cation diffusion facilitator CzcD-associated flavoprotein CzcO
VRSRFRDTRNPVKEREPAPRAPPEVRARGASRQSIAIIGAGIAGLCMGIRLKQAGIQTFTIYEKASKVGGTWRENKYPGSGCDIPSHLYSFSFEPNPGFSHKYSLQPEIERYLDHCADKYGILPHVRFDTEITGARFDEAAGHWKIRTSAGVEDTADVIVSGTGQLNRPTVPHFPGLTEFVGTTFHSALYRRDHDLSGKRVAVIGNGASAIQLIPHVAEQAARLFVFQRTPNWIVPRGDRAYGTFARWAFRHVPFVLYLYRALIFFMSEVRFFGLKKESPLRARTEEATRQFMESQVASPALRAALTPTYPMGCKRVLISDDYYPALERDNVELVTDAIDRFSPDGVVTKSGAAHPVDTVVFATGFETTTFLAPMEIEGRGGRRLSEAWREGAEAYLGVAVAGFPNLFLLYGPNTNLGHNSIIFMIECQVGYVLQCLERLRDGRSTLRSTLEVRPEAMRLFNEQLQRDLEQTAWGEGCTSWYKTASGKVTNNWSGFTVQYWWKTRTPDFAAFEERTIPPT